MLAMNEATAFVIGLTLCFGARFAYCVWHTREYGVSPGPFGAVNGAEYGIGGLVIGWILFKLTN